MRGFRVASYFPDRSSHEKQKIQSAGIEWRGPKKVQEEIIGPLRRLSKKGGGEGLIIAGRRKVTERDCPTAVLAALKILVRYKSEQRAGEGAR